MTHASVSASGAQPSSSPATTAVPQRRRHRPAPLSPLQDYQSDDALNAPAPTSPATPLRSPRQPVSPSPWAQRTGFATQAFPPPLPQARASARTPTVPASVFAVPGIQHFTRESWAERKVALITGITGQDGSYLTEREWRWRVHGRACVVASVALSARQRVAVFTWRHLVWAAETTLSSR